MTFFQDRGKSIYFVSVSVFNIVSPIIYIVYIVYVHVLLLSAMTTLCYVLFLY